jgi:hypothetical protein
VTVTTRRLRAATPLPGQLTLDLPGLPLPAELPAPAPRRARPAGTGEPGTPTGGGGPGLAPRLLPTRHTGDGPGVVARVPVAVWAVWDGEDLVGVYAQESTARTDAAVLQRDARRAGVRAGSVDCLPLQVYTEPQHTRR